MNNFKYAIICVDDDFLILQTLKFQLSKCIDDRCVLIESFLSPEDALLTIEDLIEKVLEKNIDEEEIKIKLFTSIISKTTNNCRYKM